MADASDFGSSIRAVRRSILIVLLTFAAEFASLLSDVKTTVWLFPFTSASFWLNIAKLLALEYSVANLLLEVKTSVSGDSLAVLARKYTLYFVPAVTFFTGT